MVTDINSGINQLRRTATATDKIYRDELLPAIRDVATKHPELEVLVLAEYMLSEYLETVSKNWVLATKYRLINTANVNNLGVEVSSLVLGQDPKLVVKYTGKLLSVPYIGPIVGWDVVEGIRQAWVDQFGEIVNPMSLFIYAGIKWFHTNNWTLIHNTAQPGDLDFTWIWLSADRHYSIDMEMNYSTIPADYESIQAFSPPRTEVSE